MLLDVFVIAFILLVAFIIDLKLDKKPETKKKGKYDKTN